MKNIYKYLLALVLAIGLSTNANSQDYVAIGSGTSNSYGYELPTYNSYGYSFTEQIVTASEMGNESRTIDALAFQYFYDSPITRTCAIYIGHTTKSAFSSGGDYVPVDGLQQVFDGEVTFSASYTDYWNLIALSSSSNTMAPTTL